MYRELRVRSILDQFLECLSRRGVSEELPALLLDVRSESEYFHDHLPHAVNIPILNDEERRLVGISYKEKGPKAAVNLGHELVKGELRENRIQKWVEATRKGAVFLSCWRGGLRSKIAQDWLRENGVAIDRIEGGTKALRRRLIEILNSLKTEDIHFVIRGRTGSGKTKLLNQLEGTFGFLDLEKFAHHRGSAFGSQISNAQPQQAVFENRVAIEWLHLRSKNKKILVEGESKLIGRSVIPLRLYGCMLEAPSIVLEVPIEERIGNIFQEYILKPLHSISSEQLEAHYKKSLEGVRNRLGGKNFSEIWAVMSRAFAQSDLNLHRIWIRRLLEDYYDKLYDHAHARTAHKISFRGPAAEILDFLKNHANDGA